MIVKSKNFKQTSKLTLGHLVLILTFILTWQFCPGQIVGYELYNLG